MIFSWGDTIFNPDNVQIPNSLIKHEEMHGHRQRLGGVEDWWEQYLHYPPFRLGEEMLAHQAEYEVLIAEARNRNDRRRALTQVSKRLSGPLYGNMIPLKRAKKYLKGA